MSVVPLLGQINTYKFSQVENYVCSILLELPWPDCGAGLGGLDYGTGLWDWTVGLDLVDWITGLDWGTGLWDWTEGLDYGTGLWTGLRDWTWWTGLRDWTEGLDSQKVALNWFQSSAHTTTLQYTYITWTEFREGRWPSLNINVVGKFQQPFLPVCVLCK